MAAKNAIVPQVSLNVKVAIVVVAMLIKAKGVKAGSRPAFCLVSNPLEGRFSNAQAERAAAIKSRTR